MTVISTYKKDTRRKVFLKCVLGVLSTYMSVHQMHMYCPRMPEEGIISPGIRITDGCELQGTEPWSFRRAESAPEALSPPPHMEFYNNQSDEMQLFKCRNSNRIRY